MRFFSEDLKKKNKKFGQQREEYAIWRKELEEINKPFFMIPTDFKYTFLKDVSGGALKLFLFLGFHSKYQTGESWYTIEQASTFFEKDPRTVANWFKELEDKGMIFREQKGFKMKANTFLRPYGFRFDLMETGEWSDHNNVVLDLEESLDIGYKPVSGLLLNYAFEDYTFLLIYQDGTEYPCSCFFNYDMDTVKALRVRLKKYNITFDRYDIETSISAAKNQKQTIYNYLLKYLDEQHM